MNFNLIPSLQQITLAKIATSLWEIHTVITDFVLPNSGEVFTEYDTMCKNMQVIVKGKVFQLPLPVQLKKKISGLIKPIAFQIKPWLNVHNSRLDTKSVKFYWTMRGTIDDKKTAEMLIQDETTQVPTRCEIADIYCLENEYTLWKEYNNRETNKLGLSNESFVSAMMVYLEGEISKLNAVMKTFCGDLAVSAFERAFRLSALSANEAATRYLLQKLSPEEKERTLVETAVHLIRRHSDVYERIPPFFCRTYFTNVLCFMLSVMTEEQQATVFNQEPYKILVCFLNWPWQCFFLEILERVVSVLSIRHVYDLLFDIHDKIEKEFDDYDYEYLFVVVWKKSPNAHKEVWFYEDDLWVIIYNFLIFNLENVCMMMVKDILAVRAPAFIFHSAGIHICRSLIWHNMWYFFEFVIQKCIVTEESLIKFKELLKADISACSSSGPIDERENMWKVALEKITEYIRFDEQKNVECAQPLFQKELS